VTIFCNPFVVGRSLVGRSLVGRSLGVSLVLFLYFSPATDRHPDPDSLLEKAKTMRATAILDLVRRLLRQEAAESQDQEALIAAAERVSDKLCAHLSKRIGQEGFRTLLARALTLATVHFPQLSGVRVGADGSLVGLREVLSQQTPDRETWEDAVDGAAALLAHFLGLLITFIGEDLTLRILSTVWPELDWDNAAGGEKERP
jgi:hypothetical protein